MSNEMIERVAEAIWKSLIFGDYHAPLKDQAKELQARYHAIARAAIEALEMIDLIELKDLK